MGQIKVSKFKSHRLRFIVTIGFFPRLILITHYTPKNITDPVSVQYTVINRRPVQIVTKKKDSKTKLKYEITNISEAK